MVRVQRQVTDPTSRERTWKMGSIKDRLSSFLNVWAVLAFDPLVDSYGFLSQKVRTAFSGGRLLRQNAGLVPLLRIPFGVRIP